MSTNVRRCVDYHEWLLSLAPISGFSIRRNFQVVKFMFPQVLDRILLSR